ncbi:thioesterase family protein [Mycobacterium koreense]|uniref:Acyl-CoA thioesterase II n=1 Tax=Mycolicibacillus koreensis TaxID=1069220 RepID=A0A7I7SGK8_9MYCO|nr:acyl-CoA thioesterase domain-containing protein [Mycolicibacillus koreensis]MCV7248188.1 thioesterase family protein [Mycolicibacillus koreensis]OSC35707.1 acyl-CoA thioesterase II [Mycolicibacillus koreensis]BBY55125.1 acyl-CoA thioesterase II [Mycolicibacillus koreensis]
MSYRFPALADVIATLKVEPLTEHRFRATQLDNPAHHIVGGHIAGQALMAAALTAPGRVPHSAHTYYVRAGDASRPVELRVAVIRDGGTLATRQVTAHQDDTILLETLASFSTDIDAFDYHRPPPDVPDPDTLPPVQQQLAGYADEHGGVWTHPRPFELRYIDAPPRLAQDLPDPPPRTRLWWRPSEPVPNDPVLAPCLLTYLSGVTMLESALVARRATQVSTFNALIDHALWFQRPVDLSDWVLSDQSSPSGTGGRGLVNATMYNRSGHLVCTATQELYFGRG